MAQTVYVILDEAAKARLPGIAEDRARSLKHILRTQIVLLSGEHLTVQLRSRPA